MKIAEQKNETLRLINVLSKRLNVSENDVENAMAFILPRSFNNFPRYPQNESKYIHEILIHITMPFTYSEKMKMFPLFTKYGLCYSVNQMKLTHITRSM